MVYQLPPLTKVLGRGGGLVTNAVANTATLTALLPTPGAGFRYRVVAMRCGALQTFLAAPDAIGPPRFFVSLFDGVVPAYLTHARFTSQTSADDVYISPPGITFSVDAVLQIESFCSAAAQAWWIAIQYYIDAVT